MVNRRQQRKEEVTTYVGGINEENLELLWKPIGCYLRAHGDSKSSLNGIYTVNCMLGHDTKYHIRLLKATVEMFHKTYDGEPSAAKVLEDLQRSLKTAEDFLSLDDHVCGFHCITQTNSQSNQFRHPFSYDTAISLIGQTIIAESDTGTVNTQARPIAKQSMCKLDKGDAYLTG
ncbi:hypothetical protein PHISCL_00759 [Aspergillus sclerotialis]|uniref:Uncharacterized protein n=1 Tax=Aspergillus sclerotialis TaxID=2070753 RepID=A0A3A2ZUX9_9EURO|nr:hypothetical protein PHISCL_00759 [Aspergillus sclerotialis]